MESSYDPNFIIAFMFEFEASGVMDMSLFMLGEDPKTFKEAMSSKDVSFWREAVNSELNSIISIIASASSVNLFVHQMDIKTTFQNEDLDE